MKTHELNQLLAELIQTREFLRNARDHAKGRYRRWRIRRKIRGIQRQIDSTLEQLAEARAKADREQASV